MATKRPRSEVGPSSRGPAGLPRLALALALALLLAAGGLVCRAAETPPPRPTDLRSLNKGPIHGPQLNARPDTKHLTRESIRILPPTNTGADADPLSRQKPNHNKPENSINRPNSQSSKHLDDSSTLLVNDNVSIGGKAPTSIRFGESSQRAPIDSISPTDLADPDQTGAVKYSRSARGQRHTTIVRQNRNRILSNNAKRRNYRNQINHPRRHSKYRASNLVDRLHLATNDKAAVNGKVQVISIKGTNELVVKLPPVSAGSTVNKQPLNSLAERPKRYSYVNSNGVIQYTYLPLVECCDYAPPGCRYNAPIHPIVRPSYGPWSRQWKGLRYGKKHRKTILLTFSVHHQRW